MGLGYVELFLEEWRDPGTEGPHHPRRSASFRVACGFSSLQSQSFALLGPLTLAPRTPNPKP